MPRLAMRLFSLPAAFQEDFVAMQSTGPEVVHIVLFRWSEAATPEAIGRVIEALRGLRDQIPGILDLACGENFSSRAQGYTHGLVVRFLDRAALDAYGPHPIHRRVVEELIRPIAADILAMDFALTP